MFRGKLYLGIVILSAVALVMGGCVSESGLAIKDAANARDAALTYLLERESQNAPGAGISWQEEDVTPKDEAGHPVPGAVHKEFTSDEWTIKVSYAVLPPERTVYQVVVSSIKLGWHWKGSVKADGSVTEISAFKQMSKEESQRIAEEFVKNSPTFVFDGIEDTLRLTDTLTARCPYCWVFIFEFDSRYAGYGDRTGRVLAEVITPHQAAIAVEQLEITSAMIDGRWDVINEELLAVPSVTPVEPTGYSDVNIPIEQFQSQPHIDVVMSTVLGGELTVILGSNPTTGYQWSEDAEISDESVVKQINHEFVAPETDVPGTPGEEVWVFKALKRGTTTILLDYSRSWTGAGLWAVTITATIR